MKDNNGVVDVTVEQKPKISVDARAYQAALNGDPDVFADLGDDCAVKDCKNHRDRRRTQGTIAQLCTGHADRAEDVDRILADAHRRGEERRNRSQAAPKEVKPTQPAQKAAGLPPQDVLASRFEGARKAVAPMLRPFGFQVGRDAEKERRDEFDLLVADAKAAEGQELVDLTEAMWLLWSRVYYLLNIQSSLHVLNVAFPDDEVASQCQKAMDAVDVLSNEATPSYGNWYQTKRLFLDTNTALTNRLYKCLYDWIDATVAIVTNYRLVKMLGGRDSVDVDVSQFVSAADAEPKVYKKAGHLEPAVKILLERIAQTGIMARAKPGEEYDSATHVGFFNMKDPCQLPDLAGRRKLLEQREQNRREAQALKSQVTDHRGQHSLTLARATPIATKLTLINGGKAPSQFTAITEAADAAMEMTDLEVLKESSARVDELLEELKALLPEEEEPALEEEAVVEAVVEDTDDEIGEPVAVEETDADVDAAVGILRVEVLQPLQADATAAYEASHGPAINASVHADVLSRVALIVFPQEGIEHGFTTVAEVQEFRTQAEAAHAYIRHLLDEDVQVETVAESADEFDIDAALEDEFERNRKGRRPTNNDRRRRGREEKNLAHQFS